MARFSLLVALAMAVLPGTGHAQASGPLGWEGMQAAFPLHLPEGEGERIAYGPGAAQFGVLRFPEGEGPFPVAVVLHGGCWLSIADYRYMEPFTAALNDAGWATWSLEFRRIDMEGGAWPAILRDVAAGTDHLRALAGTRPLDLERVVSVGHSSGGHLALWLAGRGGLDRTAAAAEGIPAEDPLPLDGAVGLAPIADLDDFEQYTRCGSGIVDDFLAADGVPTVDAARRALSDPARMGRTATPQLLVLGALDPIVPPAHGAAFAERVAPARRAVQVEVVPGVGHFELVAPWTPGWRRVAPLLIPWMRTQVDDR